MNGSQDASYRHCQRQARRAASNFYYSFFLLPRDKRRAMCALYAFLRGTDDLVDADEPMEERRDKLQTWHDCLQHALSGDLDDSIWPAVADTVDRYSIPAEFLFQAIDGARMDLDCNRYATFSDLERYCYLAASVVGLSCIHVWGYRDERAHQLAAQCGIAFQLTNILRDLKEDAQRDRIYLPLEDLQRFGYAPEELKRGVCDQRFLELMKFEIDRTERFYAQAQPLENHLHDDGRRVFRTMVATYRSLLDDIKRTGGDVLQRRIRVGPWRKARIAASWMVK